MEIKHFQSSNLEWGMYLDREKLLLVKFKDAARIGSPTVRGGIYAYTDVPLGTWRRVVQAASPGAYFAAHVRGKFKTNRIT